ncbi:hypothetical protein [Deinococcus roseus]|uniref:Uncharacterized protein n=1 Tax=Deinococcus roseus TaxID=392414 RepID=A0ABQ2CZX7_9DEIO|nr:hypothetical protein [Deinococcus roseus]GGJ32638.1 hypothetical protein GCM10008938_18570 [Deinococcus roseus]
MFYKLQMGMSGKNRKYQMSHLRNYPGRIQYDEVDPFTEKVVFELDGGEISDHVCISVRQFVFTDRARGIIEQHRLPDDDYAWAPVEVYRTSDRHTFHCHALRLPARDFLDLQQTGFSPFGTIDNPVVDEQKAAGISIYRQQG